MWQPQGIYNEFVLRTPVLLAGEEAVRGLYNFPAVKIAVIHGWSFTEKEKELFLNTFNKKEVQFFSRSWSGEPDMQGIQGTVHEIEKFSPDTIIAIGGGSVIDGAKLCRLFYELPYFAPQQSKLSNDLLKTKFIAVPTTIGSGAEVSSAAVYIEGHEHGEHGHINRKEMVVLHELQPEVIIYDERYLKQTPHRLLLASAMDAASHLIEGYVSKMKNSIAEMKAEEGLRLLHEELGKFINNLNNRAFDSISYQRLQYAGHLGGIVQNHCIVGAAHALAHQMTDYSHSEAISLLLPPVIKMNSKDEATSVKYNVLACNAGFKGISDLVNFLENVSELAITSERRRKMKKYLYGKLLSSTKRSEQSKMTKSQLSDVQSNAQDVNCVNNVDNFFQNVKLDRGGKGNPVDITDDYIVELIGGL